MKKKENQKKEVKKPITQADFVVDYLVRKGRKGATNFEMMMNLHLCDVRKIISDINADKEAEFSIQSKFETNPETKKTYKRYWAVPEYATLEEIINESKHIRKTRSKRANRSKR